MPSPSARLVLAPDPELIHLRRHDSFPVLELEDGAVARRRMNIEVMEGRDADSCAGYRYRYSYYFHDYTSNTPHKGALGEFTTCTFFFRFSPNAFWEARKQSLTQFIQLVTERRHNVNHKFIFHFDRQIKTYKKQLCLATTGQSLL